MIEGIYMTPLSVMDDSNGCVLHMMRENSSLFKKFGEVYFSEVLKARFKGWKLHKTQTQNICVPVGRVRFYLFDSRLNSASYLESQTVELSREVNYQLITIPPGIWYGFQGLADGVNLLANIVDTIHNPTESIRLPLESELIPVKILNEN